MWLPHRSPARPTMSERRVSVLIELLMTPCGAFRVGTAGKKPPCGYVPCCERGMLAGGLVGGPRSRKVPPAPGRIADGSSWKASRRDDGEGVDVSVPRLGISAPRRGSRGKRCGCCKSQRGARDAAQTTPSGAAWTGLDAARVDPRREPAFVRGDASPGVRDRSLDGVSPRRLAAANPGAAHRRCGSQGGRRAAFRAPPSSRCCARGARCAAATGWSQSSREGWASESVVAGVLVPVRRRRSADVALSAETDRLRGCRLGTEASDPRGSPARACCRPPFAWPLATRPCTSCPELPLAWRA